MASASRRAAAKSGSCPIISGNAGAAAGNDRQGERVQYYGIHRGVFGRRQNVRARSGESLVEMQRYAPVAAAGEQRIRQGAADPSKERRGQPGGAVTVQELSRFATIGAVEEVPSAHPDDRRR